MGSLVSDELWLEAPWLYLAKALWVCSVLWRRDGWDVKMRTVRSAIEVCVQQHEKGGATPRRLRVLLDLFPLEDMQQLAHTQLFSCIGCGEGDVPTWPNPHLREDFEQRWCAQCWQSWGRSGAAVEPQWSRSEAATEPQ